MPGWKKNIPACLQPDQEGGKTGPGRAEPLWFVPTGHECVRVLLYLRLCVLVCIYSVCACARARVLANYRRCDLVQRGLAPPAELVQTDLKLLKVGN